MKRQKFLETFLGALGAKQILWTTLDDNSVVGTVIYDTTNIDERQDFVWHMTENKMPNDKVIDLLKYLINESLLEGDKLKVPITEIEIPNMDNETKNKLFDELLNVSVNMIDDGKETDLYFIHD
jgi:hypothetical protein